MHRAIAIVRFLETVATEKIVIPFCMFLVSLVRNFKMDAEGSLRTILGGHLRDKP